MSFANYHQLRTLVVDDFQQFTRVLSGILEELEIPVVDTAVNGNQAIKRCKSKTYDVIFCDYNLGDGKNGLHVLETLRSRGLLKHNQLFILLTAETSKTMVMATYDYEPDAYISKPINGKVIKQRLDRLLSQREALEHIYDELERGQISDAIAACERLAEAGGRYALKCQKLLGDLYLEQKNYEQAEKLYTSALNTRPQDWAKLGLARVYVAQGDTQKSALQLRELIENSPHCMQAYDLLVDINEAEGTLDQAQVLLKDAVEISPLSILRQQKMADLAFVNNDFSESAEAYRQSVKLGVHSCYDRAEDYFGLGRTVAAIADELEEPDQLLYQDALRALEAVNNRFKPNKQLILRSLLIQSTLQRLQGNNSRAEELLQEAETEMPASLAEIGVEAVLDWITTLTANGQEERAQKILGDLLRHYQSDEQALRAIDRLLDEPKSVFNRKRVAALNREGIGLYEQHKFNESIDCFTKAKRLFPKHTGILLNLVQALNGELLENGDDPKLSSMCRDTLDYVEKNIEPTHPQYARFRQLFSNAQSLTKK